MYWQFLGRRGGKRWQRIQKKLEKMQAKRRKNLRPIAFGILAALAGLVQMIRDADRPSTGAGVVEATDGTTQPAAPTVDLPKAMTVSEAQNGEFWTFGRRTRG